MPVTRENVLSAIREAKAVQDVTRLRDDVKLSDQGIDSLEIFNVLLVISERYNIDIPDEDTDQLNTIKQIVEYLNRRLT